MVTMKRRLLKEQLVEAGIFEDYHGLTLAKYRGPTAARKVVKGYIAKLPQMRNDGSSMLFWGTNNAGKTTLAMILAKAFLINDFSVKCTTLREMTDVYCSGWNDDDAKSVFNRDIRDVDFLVIDDLNKELHNKATAAVLDQVLRYRSNRHLPFCITTNCDMDELEDQYGPSFVALIKRRAFCLEFRKGDRIAKKLHNKSMQMLAELAEEGED